MGACNKCKKTASEVSLKRCAKCSTTPYCSRDCQKADWKAHRKTCGREPRAAAGPASTRLSPPKGLKQPIVNPFTRLGNKTWLHDRPEVDVYALLIDAYRMRVEDEYNIEGNITKGSLYDGAADGLGGFRNFLDLVESRPGILPSWWNPDKRVLCEKQGMDASQWHSLHSAVEKSDIMNYYGDQRFPMQLRMFAEDVIGRGIGGADGSQMRGFLASMEVAGPGEGLHASMLDLTTSQVTQM
ncbi:hypothetical protein jhhlp_003289 [Lomentospora prolificans]|uniref:MYND-type domain-containing protein n=1 Tax=Lomentospora prolificans TaxID=41688 RepID=A0A2N3NGG8_9PEZI|nr:hypothetical protein jhhlp_003289 [Lomentospora prolificans]